MLDYISLKADLQVSKFIEPLYIKSFPLDEQVPFDILKNQALKPISDLIAVFDHKIFIGLLSLVYFEDIVFIWYLAIEESKRNLGYGSKILQEIQSKYEDRRIILNIEECLNDKDKLKRKAFYLKNGFKECAYKTMEYGVRYEMLYSHGFVTYEEYARMMINYSGIEVFNAIYRKVEE